MYSPKHFKCHSLAQCVASKDLQAVTYARRLTRIQAGSHGPTSKHSEPRR